MTDLEAARPRPRLVHLSDQRVRREAKHASAEHAVTHAWALFVAGGENHASVRRPKTVQAYRTAVAWATEKSDPPLPRHPTAGDVRLWRNMLVQRHGLAAATVNMYLRALRAVVNAADRARDYQDQELRALAAAVAACKPFDEPPRAPRCPPRDALWRALDIVRATAGNPTRAAAESAFVMLMATGLLRVGEALGLMPGDYDPVTHRLHVQRTRGSDRRKNGRGGHSHYVQLGPTAFAALEYVLANRDRIKPRQGWHRGRCDAYVFPWNSSKVDGLMRRIRAGLGADAAYFPPRTAWHAFRHLGASEVAEYTHGDVLRVQEALGDRSPTVAMTYCSRVRGLTTGDAESLERRMFEAMRQRELVRSRVPAGVSTTDRNTGSTELANRVGDPDSRTPLKGQHNV